MATNYLIRLELKFHNVVSLIILELLEGPQFLSVMIFTIAPGQPFLKQVYVLKHMTTAVGIKEIKKSHTVCIKKIRQKKEKLLKTSWVYTRRK